MARVDSRAFFYALSKKNCILFFVLWKSVTFAYVIIN